MLPALAAAVVLAGVAQSGFYAPGLVGLDRFLTLGLAGALAYAAAVWLVLHRPMPKGALLVVLVAAALMRVTPLLLPPYFSTDLYRYVWDGRVQLAGINPYRYLPADPALAPLRDGAMFALINRADYAPTIYPPFAQMLFAVIAAAWPSPWGVKLAMTALEAAGVLVMLRLLRLAGLPRERVLLYAWQPGWAWEYAGNGHVDAAVLPFVGLALLAAARRRDGVAGLAIGLATGLKLLPVVIAPALWRGRGWRMPAVAVGTVLLGYAAYASVGARVLGFLGGYAQEEGLASGGGLLGVQLLGAVVSLPPWAGAAWLLLAALLLAALALRMLSPAPAEPQAALRRLASDAMLLASVTLLTLSPHYAWYFGWLAYLACLVPWISVLWLTTASALLYVDPGHVALGWSSLIYLPVPLLAWRDLRRAAPLRGDSHVRDPG